MSVHRCSDKDWQDTAGQFKHDWEWETVKNKQENHKRGRKITQSRKENKPLN